MIGRRSIGTATQTTAEALEIKILRVGKVVGKKVVRAKESAHIFRARIAIADAGIVGAETAEESFVVAKKRSGVRFAFIADDDDPAARFQNAREFIASSDGIEPVESLSHGDEINAALGKGGSFG